VILSSEKGFLENFPGFIWSSSSGFIVFPGQKAPPGGSKHLKDSHPPQQLHTPGKRRRPMEAKTCKLEKVWGGREEKKKLVYVCFVYVKRVTKTYKNLSDQISLLAKEVNVCVGSGFRPRIPRFFHPFLITTLLWGPLVRKGI